MRAASALTIHESPPLGDVALAPAAMGGIPEAQLARSMTNYLHETAPDSGAEALALLRRMFPHSPLAARVAALAAAMRR
jgi:hypothetical protein